jgi:hypothetical protein
MYQAQFYQNQQNTGVSAGMQSQVQNISGAVQQNSPHIVGTAQVNPYSKPPSASIIRPPSTTIYQQGYK